MMEEHFLVVEYGRYDLEAIATLCNKAYLRITTGSVQSQSNNFLY